MPISSSQTRPIEYPEIPFDKYLVNLSIVPLVLNTNVVEAAMSLILTPYRILPDGTIDTDEGNKVIDTNNACFAAAASDPVMGQVADMVFTAIQTYIIGKNL